jgi:ankyrin repeat protein
MRRSHILGSALLGLLLFTSVSPAQTPDENELSLAARRSDTAKVKELLAKGVSANTKFRYGATALAFACDRGHVEIVKLLLEHGAEVNVRDTFYNATPIQWAISPAATRPT